jgi:predicted DNA-binding transcriptional regulator AlpA
MESLMAETTEVLTPRKLIDADSVRERVGGLSLPTLWRMRQKGTFPEPVRVSPGRVAWYADEIDEWIASRVSSRAA